MKIDFLASPVTLNFKGSATYDSLTGFFCSLLILAAFACYLGYGIIGIQLN